MGFFSKMKDAQQQAQDAMAAGAAGGGGAGAAMGDMQGQAAYAQAAQKLAQQGVEAPGVVHAIRRTGEKEFGGSEKIEFDVSIRPAAGDPYQTTIRQSMLPAQLERIAEGQAITVKYDPDAPAMALIYGW
jgi:hypothetical protein